MLNGILKDELGFQGFVQSDWLAQRSGVDSALSGLYECISLGLLDYITDRLQGYVYAGRRLAMGEW